jgi:hypothetical protein
MMRLVKYFFLDNGSAGFKLAPALLMILLFLLFQGSILYILFSAWMDS